MSENQGRRLPYGEYEAFLIQISRECERIRDIKKKIFNF